MTIAMRTDLAGRVDEIAVESFEGFRARVVADAVSVYVLLHDVWGVDYERKVAELRLAAVS